MPSYFVESVEVGGGRTWACRCSIFTCDSVGVEVNIPHC